MKAVSLMGSQRVGKTFTAKAFAKKHDIEFVSASVSPAYQGLGIPMGAKLEYNTRIELQEYALSMYQSNISGLHDENKSFITDRCFLDLIGYSLVEFPTDASEADAEWLTSYTHRCIQLTNKYYDNVVMFRPGIPLTEDATSWSGNLGVVNKVDACMLWSADQYGKATILDKSIISLIDRISALDNITKICNPTELQHLNKSICHA